MRFILQFLFVFSLSFNAFSNQCIELPKYAEKAIQKEVDAVNASEYCEARDIIYSVDGMMAVLFTSEGACYELPATPGTCGNKWERYLILFVNKEPIGNILVDMKGGFKMDSVKIEGEKIIVKGLGLGEDEDGFVKPMIPVTEEYVISNNKILEL